MAEPDAKAPLPGQVEEVLDESLETVKVGHDALAGRQQPAGRLVSVAAGQTYDQLGLHDEPSERVPEIVHDAGGHRGDVGEPLVL